MKNPLRTFPSRLVALAACPLLLGGCISASSHLASVRDPSTEHLTVGTVQSKLHAGLSSADVAEILGAPNIVTTDDQRREVWVYDKISSETAYSSSGLGLSPLLLGAQGSLAGGVSGQGSYSSGATTRTDRTLTIVVKFDEQKRVRDFAYRASQF
jgi:hypothetical protein